MLVLKKENGVVRYYLSEEAAGITGKCHLCAEDCKNLSPDICSKVEIKKRRIEEYDYITDGYQVFGEKKGEESKLYLKSFVVSGCKNYEPEGVKEKDPKAAEKKEALINMFFNAENFQDADSIRQSILSRQKEREKQSVQRVRKYTPNL